MAQERTTTSTATLIMTRLIQLGVAWVLLPEGRRVSVLRLGNGTWQYTLDAITYSGFAESGEAISDLTNRLANEGILLRFQI